MLEHRARRCVDCGVIGRQHAAFGDSVAEGFARLQPVGVGRLDRDVAEAELRLYTDGLRLIGSCPLRMSDYGIRPVTALGGSIRLKDEMRLSFDLVALPEGP